MEQMFRNLMEHSKKHQHRNQLEHSKKQQHRNLCCTYEDATLAS